MLKIKRAILGFAAKKERDFTYPSPTLTQAQPFFEK
jgi:hypothetical protein